MKLYEPEPLKVTDRCDECGVQALVRYVILKRRRKNIQELLFCGHHSRKHEKQLIAKTFVVFEDLRQA